MAKQLTFDLPVRTALGREDFFVSGANTAAVEAIQTWHEWPQGKLVLAGPHGSGKTHLAHVWATMTGATVIPAANLRSLDVDGSAHQAHVIEDAQLIAGNPQSEETLFHLHNLLAERGHALLMTADAPPARWRVQLPDLLSRLQGSALVTLTAPDDALLTAVLLKLFSDRQLAVEPQVVDYLISRMDRSFADAGRLVAALDTAALTAKRRITKPLATEVMDKLAGVVDN